MGSNFRAGVVQRSGPIADTVGYTLLFLIYGALFLLSIAALRGIQDL
jgi:hypothetical protein